jgi:light-regulated signal transduction histidine kinase (bacteriophytochrome)
MQQVQAHGAVLVVNDQNNIVGVSANAQQFFGINSRCFLGASCCELLPELADILRAPDQPGSPGRNTRLWQVRIRDVVLAVATHRNGALRFLEFEMPEPNRRYLTQGSRDALFEQFLVELEETQSAKGAALALLDHVADIVEFDRAMLIQKMFGGHYRCHRGNL